MLHFQNFAAAVDPGVQEFKFMAHKMTISDFQSFKTQGRKISVLTAYDYSFAKILDEAGVDMILVGDSLANVVLGLESTKEVGIAEMVHHARAVGRAVEYAFVVGDMPFNSYQIEGADIVGDARQLMDAKCDAVKVEWFARCLDVVRKLRAEGVPVMGHIGLTPQTVDELGGYKVQGKTGDDAKKLFDQAMMFQEAGCFAIVIECVPDRLAKVISEKLDIPTIGIGAGPDCDGQVLVLYDALGLYSGKDLKFVRRFADLQQTIKEAAHTYCDTVSARTFPSPQESFTMNDDEYHSFLNFIDGERF